MSVQKEIGMTVGRSESRGKSAREFRTAAMGEILEAGIAAFHWYF
jgi:hypothetical protein